MIEVAFHNVALAENSFKQVKVKRVDQGASSVLEMTASFVQASIALQAGRDWKIIEKVKFTFSEASTVIFIIQSVPCQIWKTIDRNDICGILFGQFEGPTDLEWVNKTAWRMRKWEDLYNPRNWIIEEQRPSDTFHDFAIKAEEVDEMFSNRAAVSTFVQFLSYYPRNDETVLSPARADPWITESTVFLSSRRQRWETKYTIQ